MLLCIIGAGLICAWRFSFPWSRLRFVVFVSCVTKVSRSLHSCESVISWKYIYLFEDKIILIYMYHRNVKHRCYTICGSAICLQTRNQLYRHLEEVTWQMKKCYLLLKVTALFSALKYEKLIYKRICCVTNIYFIEHFPHKNTFNTSIQTTYQE